MPESNPEDIFFKDNRRRQLQKAAKYKQKNREPRKPRRKDWMDLSDEGLDEYDEYPDFERIMPRDEGERRRAIETILANDPGEPEQPGEERPDGIEGLVIEVSSGMCRVSADGEALLCSVRGSLTAEQTGYTHVVAVGDRVIISRVGEDQGVVEHVLPRRSQIARPDPGTGYLKQVLAANVDQLLIVAAWRQPNLWPELIDRYLITAIRSQIAPVICVNKIDLAASPDEIEETISPYRALGYSILLTSAQRGDGLESLSGSLTGKITVLAGLSGVGKSSLLTAIHPEFDLRVGRVNEEWGQGRHTTTQAVMIPFGENGFVIDTPGIREFGLAGLRQRDLDAFYPEIAALAPRCHFNDCSHLSEPGCAVRAGVGTGTVSGMRYDNYQKIRATLLG